MAQLWIEELSRRTRTGKTRRLYENGAPVQDPDGRFKWSLDAQIGTSSHYRNGAGEWEEVDTRLVPSSEPGWDWEMAKSHWRLLVRENGWVAAEKEGVGFGFRLIRAAYLNIQTKEYQFIRDHNYAMITPTVEEIPTMSPELRQHEASKMTWPGLFDDIDLELYCRPDGISEQIKVSQTFRDSPPALPYPAADTYLVFVYRVDWSQVPGLADEQGDIDYETDFQREGRLFLKNAQNQVISALPLCHAYVEGMDPDIEPVPLRKRFIKVAGEYYLLMGAPVLALNALPAGTIVFDPTINKQVGASADDGGAYDSNGTWTWIPIDFSELWIGYVHDWSRLAGAGHRFSDVTVPQGATIDTSYITLTAKVDRSGDTVKARIVGDDEDDAATFSTLANYQSRRGTDVGGANDNLRTTEDVDWPDLGHWTTDTEYNTPSINPVAQEILNRSGWSSGNHMVFFVDDHEDRSTHGSNCVRHSYSWDGVSTKAAKLHIEYTAGGGTIELAGTSAGVAAVSGIVKAAWALKGSSDGIAAVTGNVVRTFTLDGLSGGTASVLGDLYVSVPLAGISEGVASVVGNLPVLRPLIGSSDGAASVSGNLVRVFSLQGTSDSIATVSGVLKGTWALKGLSTGAALVSGQISITQWLAGLSEGLASATGKLTGTWLLKGVSMGIANVVGSLTIAGAGAIPKHLLHLKQKLLRRT